jgi:anti-sigma B factor antagonist
MMPHTEVGLKIDENVREDVAVLSVSGALMSGPEVSEFHEHIKRLVKDGIVNVVADFSKVKWFGSSMLGVMTASLTTLRNEGGDLRLTGITKKIESILMVTQLASIFRTIDNVDRAIASFKTQPPDPKQPE